MVRQRDIRNHRTLSMTVETETLVTAGGRGDIKNKTAHTQVHNLHKKGSAPVPGQFNDLQITRK